MGFSIPQLLQFHLQLFELILQHGYVFSVHCLCTSKGFPLLVEVLLVQLVGDGQILELQQCFSQGLSILLRQLHLLVEHLVYVLVLRQHALQLV